VTRGIHWFRNDLRIEDNTALADLASRTSAWLPVFVLDPMLTSSRGAGARRMHFLLDCLARLGGDLARRGLPLVVLEGRPEVVLPVLMKEAGARILSFNDDVTPFARRRDAEVRLAVEQAGGEVRVSQDHVVFGAAEIRTAVGGAYSVYTPYKNTWWRQWRAQPRLPMRTPALPPAIPGFEQTRIPDPHQLGLTPSLEGNPTGGHRAAQRRLDRFLESAAARYHEDRDRPDVDGTSRLSPYLRFGVISARRCFERAEQAMQADPASRRGIEKWLDELVWREFYSAVLEENPRVLRENHRKEFDSVVWNEDPESFEAWCEGRTGFPIVDAGMRQLRETGWMHNRVRMIVASFLTKDLLIDWRKGERFFFDRLVDGDPASNNGGWQWAASTGTDAQPYFRIFNPAAQGRRWDPEGVYVRRWIPELADVPDEHLHAPGGVPRSKRYPSPIIDHGERRKLALERFKSARARAMGASRGDQGVLWT
jgi:deoxyribodipyrimidine photo-lyase